MSVEPVGTAPAAGPAASKLDPTEMQRLLEILKMRLFLINSQAATTRGQIVVMEDAVRRTAVWRRLATEQGAPLRTTAAAAPSATLPERSLAPVRRRSTRAFAARIKARRKIVVKPERKKPPPVDEAVAADTAAANSGRWCAVCLTGIDDAEFTETACTHTFHGQCIDRWVAEKFDDPTCPVCRTQLFVPS